MPVLQTVQNNAVTIITGDTGSGKTSLVPQFLMDAGVAGAHKQIVCTQPRRISAITMAEYVAKQRGIRLGGEVGYQICFVNKITDQTRLIYATTAIILRRLHTDPFLGSVGMRCLLSCALRVV